MRRPANLTMTSFTLVSKSRKPKFELTFKIIDLNNVPLVSGTSSVKWHLPSSTSAEHRGRTEKATIENHAVTWDHTTTLPVRLSIDRHNNLLETLLQLEVQQEYSSGVGRAEKITLGNLSLNLAEYVEVSESEGEEGVVRRYLMQDSKINSTLKIGIAMKQIDGERNFVAPALKTAPVFGGIAGVMGQEQGESDEPGYMPSIGRSREAGELQDMYRKSVAAYWAAQAGELPADECIEDIFSGGDGWRSKNAQNRIPPPRQSLHPGHQEEPNTDYDNWPPTRHPRHRRDHSSSSNNSHTQEGAALRFARGRDKDDDTTFEGIREAMHHSIFSDLGRRHRRHGRRAKPGHGQDGFIANQEINEMNVRENLVAWKLPQSRNLVNYQTLKVNNQV